MNIDVIYKYSTNIAEIQMCYFLQAAPEEVAEKRLYSKKPSEYLEKKFRTLGDEALECQNKCKYW
jgi:hypothetical protein